ncbi:HNH endonuclease [Peribacillus frigoritolerans]|uniref:HNH endonuclease n=1 Tax=Peribacillus frigoritolerans TaxID=450367 RepID=UPI00342AE8CC
MTEYKTEAQKRTFYKSGAWNKLRQLALDRDNRECQECKREGRVHVDSIKVEGDRKSVELNVHHKYEIEDYPQLALVLDNLTTLCLNCHNKMHGRVFGEQKRKRWDDEMW